MAEERVARTDHRVDTVDTVDSGYQGIGNAKCNATEQYLFCIYIFCSMYIGLSKLTIYVSEERCPLRTYPGVPQKIDYLGGTASRIVEVLRKTFFQKS